MIPDWFEYMDFQEWYNRLREKARGSGKFSLQELEDIRLVIIKTN
jgi:hypothetical protein